MRLRLRWMVLAACATAAAQVPQPTRRGLPVPHLPVVARADCTFFSQSTGETQAVAGSRFLRQQLESRALMARRSLHSALPAGNVPRRTILDSYILDELARRGVLAAPPATDEEFLRRIYLDLAGRVPTLDETRAFLADTTAGKRDQLVDRLLASPEFTDRWTLYFDDLFQVTASLSNVFRDTPGTLNYHNWVHDSVRTGKSIAQMARELLTGAGNNFDAPTAPTNFIVNANVDNGPDQDFYDKAAVNAVRTFLGNRTIDCTGCHNGRGHADTVSLWAASRTRMQFWQIAAFFSQTTLNQPDVPMTDPHYNSFVIDIDPTRVYFLNTDYGNRPARRPVAGADSVAPVYFNGATPHTNNWRSEFAGMLVNDPQFSLNFANRLFAQIFGVGLVPAVESLDPARLDPQNPPPAPWKLQASHPDLLVRLAQELADDGYQLRPFLRMLVTSSVYQFSSQYDGNWTPANGILFERHYVKRLEGEFLADAIADVTGVPGNYTVDGLPGMLRAVQLPDISEPASDGIAYDLMFPFSRGNRDNQKRNQVFSLTQQLRLLNSSFILDRLSSSPALASVASAASNDAAVDELFLRFLARRPASTERIQAVQYLAAAQTPDDRSQALQDLAWAILNQPDFLLLQ